MRDERLMVEITPMEARVDACACEIAQALVTYSAMSVQELKKHTIFKESCDFLLEHQDELKAYFQKMVDGISLYYNQEHL